MDQPPPPPPLHLQPPPPPPPHSPPSHAHFHCKHHVLRLPGKKLWLIIEYAHSNTISI